MRAGLARAVATQMQTSTALAVDSICEASITDNILNGQPAALPCPHRDCGILAVRVTASGASSSKTPDGSSTSCCCRSLLADAVSPAKAESSEMLCMHVSAFQVQCQIKLCICVYIAAQGLSILVVKRPDKGQFS